MKGIFTNQVTDFFDEFSTDGIYICQYSNSSVLLPTLSEKYGSDKGGGKGAISPFPWPLHTYTDLYSRFFDHCRESIRLVLEVGIGSNNCAIASNMTTIGRPGASLRVWKDYFPSADIYGADIDKDILFQEDRIRTLFVDQTNSDSVREMWRIIDRDGFDLIIDDGLHQLDAGICLFENSFHKLRSGGLYIIEDVNYRTLLEFSKYFENLNIPVDFVSLHQPGHGFLKGNNMCVIRK